MSDRCPANTCAQDQPCNHASEEEEQPETLKEVCDELGISIVCERNDTPASFGGDMDGWHCELQWQGRKLATPFWQGIGHREWKAATIHTESAMKRDGWRRCRNTRELPYGHRSLHDERWYWFRPIPPSAYSVLGCLCFDARMVDAGQSFEEWCSELGYDTDSRKTKRSFHECQQTALKLRGFLGDQYDRMLYAEY
mgnify:CR=1 FL=1